MTSHHPHPNRNQSTGSVSKKKQHTTPKPRSQAPKHRPTRRPTAPNKLDQPLFPGGITTYGEFLHNRKAAADAEFRPQEEQLQQSSREIPGWYQDYLTKLKGLQTQATEQFQGLGAQAASLGNEPVEGGPDAQAAAGARGNIIKAVQGALLQQQGAQTAKLGAYGAIAGAKRIQKEEELGKAKTDLAKSKGEFYTKYTADTKQREFENALAAKQFGLKQEELTAKVQSEKAAAKGKETTYDKEFSKQAAKYGFDPHDWALLGPTGRAKRIAEAQKRSGAKPKSIDRITREEEAKTATHHGYSVAEWRKLTPKQRSQVIQGKGKDKKDKDKGTELSFRTGGQRGEIAKHAAQAKSIAEKLKSGVGIGGVNKQGHKRTRADAAKVILSDPKTPEPVVVSAVLDAVYDGFISRETAKRLHTSQLKVEELARALGTLTYSEYRKKYPKGKSNWLQKTLNP